MSGLIRADNDVLRETGAASPDTGHTGQVK